MKPRGEAWVGGDPDHTPDWRRVGGPAVTTDPRPDMKITAKSNNYNYYMAKVFYVTCHLWRLTHIVTRGRAS